MSNYNDHVIHIRGRSEIKLEAICCISALYPERISQKRLGEAQVGSVCGDLGSVLGREVELPAAGGGEGRGRKGVH